MATEIERKFLPSPSFDTFINQSPKTMADGPYVIVKKIGIVQGYISQQVGRTVRLRNSRIDGVTTSVLNFKGNSVDGGLSHPEYEFVIDTNTAYDMFIDLVPTVIRKVRFEIKDTRTGLIWEVDMFDHLVVIECEFDSDEASRNFIKPDWVGDEVTGDRNYYNSVLVDRLGIPTKDVIFR